MIFGWVVDYVSHREANSISFNQGRESAREYHTDENGINHVHPYVFTYFDAPELVLEDGTELYLRSNNYVQLDGNICKKGELRKTKTGLDVLDFTIANNIKNGTSTFNIYMPVVAWGKQAKEISKLSSKMNLFYIIF